MNNKDYTDEEIDKIIAEFDYDEAEENAIASVKEFRLREHQLVMQMTKEEKVQYLIEKHKKANKMAEEDGLVVKSLTPNQDFNSGKDFDARAYLENLKQQNLAKMQNKQEGGEE